MRTGSCIGKYQGREVYKVTLPEYVNSRYYKDKYYIFLIDGELICKNEVFASYDGNYVKVYDVHKRRIFYEVPKFTVSGGIGNKEGCDTANGNSEPETSSTFGDFEFKTVDEILSDSFGSFATENFSGMTDVDAFLKANLEF